MLKIRLLNALQLQPSLSNEERSVRGDGHAPVALKCNVRRAVQRMGNDPRNRRKFTGASEKGGSKRSSVHLSTTVTKSWTPAHRQVKHRGEGEGGKSGTCRKIDVQVWIDWDCVCRNVIFFFFYLEMSPTWCGKNVIVWKQRQEERLWPTVRQMSK